MYVRGRALCVCVNIWLCVCICVRACVCVSGFFKFYLFLFLLFFGVFFCLVGFVFSLFLLLFQKGADPDNWHMFCIFIFKLTFCLAVFVLPRKCARFVLSYLN